ncbi:stimulated by retinoic acid gene 6 protein-like [Megalops cyprinoides]|uniref:stimulated by retinoic acid gene 6 protein-like n=1 Tax=Megalops cyprinoides TaxID=118141 RepID=UPI00186566B8|nr:stimulated by retinoic acid gene 6 protein-like [Megalops cyprinoides]
MATSFENFSSNLKERRGGEESASSSGEQDEFCRYTNIVHYWLIPAVLFTVIVSFLQKRRTKRAIDFKCPLNQRFGLPLPLKLLSLHSNRWAFAMAFGAIANVVVDRIGQETSVCLFNAPSWAKVFVILVSAMEVAVIHYPMFVCLTVENKVLGNLMGFVYTLAWFAFQVYKTVDQQNHKDMYEEALAVPVPALLCCTFLVLNFLRGFLKQLSSGCFRDSQDLTDLPHVTAYVKRLLKPSDAVVKKSLFQRLVYEWDPCFHFPARMIIVLVMALNTIYQTAFVQLSLVINFHEFYRNCTAEGNLFCLFFSGAFPDFDTTLIVTSFLTLFITVYHTFQIMVQYR